jgi:hypothetical protein
MANLTVFNNAAVESEIELNHQSSNPAVVPFVKTSWGICREHYEVWIRMIPEFHTLRQLALPLLLFRLREKSQGQERIAAEESN